MRNYNTLNDFLVWAESAFNEAGLYFGHGTNNAWDEAVQIARFVLGLPINAKASLLKRKLTTAEAKQLKKLAETRIQKRIPVPYLCHEAYFAGLPFYVDERVIIPRSPLAEVIEAGFQPFLGKRKVTAILDLCTGSACIAIACALRFKGATVDAIDISKPALTVATKNVKAFNLQNRVHLKRSNLFEGLSGQTYDIIISNPPYVSEKTFNALPPEYHFEPALSLVAGKQGLDLVRRILNSALAHLKPGGILIVEVGEAERALIKAYPKLPFTWLSFEHGGEGVFLLKKENDFCWQTS